MSFSAFYQKDGHLFCTNLIDLLIPEEKDQNNYYSDWMSKYKKKVYKCDPDVLAEWEIRTKKSIWELFSSSTILAEAECSLSNNCFVSFYFCLYYSLFHSMNALLYISPSMILDDVYRISHSQLLNSFESIYTGKHGMFDNSAILLFEKLKYMREYYSYNSPLNLVFQNLYDDLEATRKLVLSMNQTLFFHVFMARQASSVLVKDPKGNIDEKKNCSITDLKQRIKFNKMFVQFFSNVAVIALQEEKHELKRELKNAKAKEKRWSARTSVLNIKQKNGESVSSEDINNARRKLSSAIKDRREIEETLNKVENELNAVVLDPAAKDLLNEYESGRTRIGIDLLQDEIDYFFDQFRGYYCTVSKSAVSFDETKVWNHIYVASGL